MLWSNKNSLLRLDVFSADGFNERRLLERPGIPAWKVGLHKLLHSATGRGQRLTATRYNCQHQSVANCVRLCGSYSLSPRTLSLLWFFSLVCARDRKWDRSRSVWGERADSFRWYTCRVRPEWAGHLRKAGTKTQLRQRPHYHDGKKLD